MTTEQHAGSHRERIRFVPPNTWICVPDCGNRNGFLPCDPHGNPIPPEQARLAEHHHCVCAACGRIIERNTGDIIGWRQQPIRESSTCRHCCRYIERHGVWLHTQDGQTYRNCPSTRTWAEPVDPTNPTSILGTVLLGLRIIGASDIVVYADGFEIGGPDNQCLVWIGGTFTPAAVAAHLGLPLDAITDHRNTAVTSTEQAR
jgi:hypothetical protein